MARRLLVTGYGGFVAGSVVRTACADWQVIAVARNGVADGPAEVECVCCDLRDTERLQRVFQRAEPDAVIHAAALANIDYCQSHPADAEEVNVGVTRVLARLCRASSAKLVFCSTDTVFDGVKGFYDEEDPPAPVNVYAETKVRAERVVREEAGPAVVTRPSLVMGLPVLGAGNSFLAKMIRQLDCGERVRFPANEIRTPIDVITLGRALLELAGGDLTGTLHLAGNSRLNRYDMALQIVDRLGHSWDLVEATDSNAMAGRAPRPNDASLDNTKAKKVLRTPMRTLAEGLDLVLATTD